MKKLIFIFFFGALYFGAYAQWNLTGNTGTMPPTHFIGTTDRQPLLFKTNGTLRMQLLEDKAFVGIGLLTPPQATLHLHQQGLGNLRLLQLTTDGTQAGRNNGFCIFSDIGTKDILFKQQESAKLSIKGTSADGGLVVAPTGKVGIGTDAPEEQVHVAGKLLIDCTDANIQSRLRFKYIDLSGSSKLDPYWDMYSDGNGLKLSSTNGMGISSQKISILGNGKVGIGVAIPQAKLDVDGAFQATSANIANALSAQSATITNSLTAGSATITGAFNVQGASTLNTLTANSAEITGLFKAQSAKVGGLLCAKEVRVMLSGSPCWPDFVFGKDYKLLPLTELEQYIEENQHLPNVPSAAEVEANGIELGEMNALLLQKVEELTRYIIDLQNQIDQLKTK